jgi:hypothetical protein
MSASIKSVASLGFPERFMVYATTMEMKNGWCALARAFQRERSRSAQESVDGHHNRRDRSQHIDNCDDGLDA